MHSHQPYSTNILLNALAPDDLALLIPRLERVSVPRLKILVARDQPIEHVYFLEDGIASIVTLMGTDRKTEVGIFGREGVSATCLLLGSDRSPHETFMQIGGTSALRIATAPYLDAVERSPALRTVLLRYVQTTLVQTAQSTTTNAQVRVEARLARWLLMCHDRVDGDEIAITHDFMGMMIAADRSTVTVTLHILEGAGMIWSKRGRVIIRDRDLLEDLADDSYGVPEAEYRRLIGQLGRVRIRPEPHSSDA